MTVMSGAAAVVKSLIAEGADTVFGYPGGAIMPVYDALFDVQDQLRHILVRHEQGAVHAAEGYARTSGKIGVCIATSGPGATNLLTGITDAMIDSVPLVCITGQVTSSLLGSDAFQEADVMGMTVPVTKWNYQVTSADEIGPVLAKAFYIARSGRPGPVVVDITKDAQFGQVDFLYQRVLSVASLEKNSPKLDMQALQQAVTLINNAENPYLFVGQGVTLSGAEEELKAFSEKCHIPVASTLLGLSAFPCDHPLYVGMLGMHGNYAANKLTDEADLVVAVGMRFDDRVTGNLSKFLPNAKVVHVDIDSSEFNKIVKADVALHTDAKQALKYLTEGTLPSDHSTWLQKFYMAEQEEVHQVKLPAKFPQDGELKMAEVVNQLSLKTKGEAVIVSDVGQHQMIAARYYEFKKNQSHVTSGGLGTMGFALPAAIGAKIANPDRQVVMVAGDGGFQMNIQELAVLAQEACAVKMVVLNNSRLGMVRQWQEMFFEGRYSFTELQNPDFVAIAKGYYVKAERVSQREDLSAALDRLLESKEAYFLEVVVENEENVFPMVPTGCGASEIRLT
jgi:acetolactate synthase-1/2/3 large subunit